MSLENKSEFLAMKGQNPSVFSRRVLIAGTLGALMVGSTFGEESTEELKEEKPEPPKPKFGDAERAMVKDLMAEIPEDITKEKFEAGIKCGPHTIQLRKMAEGEDIDSFFSELIVNGKVWKLRGKAFKAFADTLRVTELHWNATDKNLKISVFGSALDGRRKEQKGRVVSTEESVEFICCLIWEDGEIPLKDEKGNKTGLVWRRVVEEKPMEVTPPTEEDSSDSPLPDGRD